MLFFGINLGRYKRNLKKHFLSSTQGLCVLKLQSLENIFLPAVAIVGKEDTMEELQICPSSISEHEECTSKISEDNMLLIKSRQK